MVLHPDLAGNNVVYLSYAEPGDGATSGAAVARATLERDEEGGGRLVDLEVIWRQGGASGRLLRLNARAN